MQRSRDGRGVINVLAADTLIRSPTGLQHVPALAAVGAVRGTAGDRRSGEARCWCSSSTRRTCCSSDAPRALLQTIEQVVRLIRSKGVGVYFVTQSPADIPDTVLGQLGNRVQHALRAYTPEGTQGRARRGAELSREPGSWTRKP
jgi:hypothetical protein